MDKIEVTIEACNKEALERGLNSIGLSIDNLTNEQLANMFSYALGFVDYTDSGIVSDMLNAIEDKEALASLKELSEEGMKEQQEIDDKIDARIEAESTRLKNKQQLLDFIKMRNENDIHNNLQFDLDAEMCGFDSSDLGNPEVRLDEDGMKYYRWYTQFGVLEEKRLKLTLIEDGKNEN